MYLPGCVLVARRDGRLTDDIGSLRWSPARTGAAPNPAIRGCENAPLQLARRIRFSKNAAASLLAAWRPRVTPSQKRRSQRFHQHRVFPQYTKADIKADD